MDCVRIRLKKELEKFLTNPPEGISCHLREGRTNILDATIIGLRGTPYEGGEFHLEVLIPFKYPFAPPTITFKTPIYHPNIDSGGRICLNVLKMPPAGSWRCALTIMNLLMSIQALMCSPNPDDPLMPDIAEEYVMNRKQFEEKAKAFTKKHCFQMEVTFPDTKDGTAIKRKLSEEEGESSTKKPKCEEENFNENMVID